MRTRSTAEFNTTTSKHQRNRFPQKMTAGVFFFHIRLRESIQAIRRCDGVPEQYMVSHTCPVHRVCSGSAGPVVGNVTRLGDQQDCEGC